MTAETPPAHAAPDGYWFTSETVPPGFWARDPSHFPLPQSPLNADFSFGYTTGYVQRHAVDAMSALTPPMRMIVVDGWQYVGIGGSPDYSPERVAAFEEKIRNGHEYVILRQWREQQRPVSVEQFRDLLAIDLAGLTDAALLSHIYRVADQRREWSRHHFTNGQAAGIIVGRFGLFCQEHLGLQQTDVLGLLAGASTATSAPVARLDALVGRAIERPALLAELRSDDPMSSPEVREMIKPWLDEYGYCPPNFELINPLFVEQPGLVSRLLCEALARVTDGNGQSHGRDDEEQSARIATLRARLPNDTSRAEFDRLLSDARAAYGVRDDDVSFAARGAGLLRLALLEAGRRLAARGLLDEREQVWFLLRAEIDEALAGKPVADLLSPARERRAAYYRQRAVTPPDTLGAPAPPQAPPALSDAARRAMAARAWYGESVRGTPGSSASSAQGEVRGIAASIGVYRGPARVVLLEDQFDRVQPGDVLICPTTTPSWNILFGSIGALVADAGGVLSHPAIIAREFGIPAVVNARTATRTIVDGQLVEVDGGAGVVRTL
jgi:pyruvate,water dikinase